MAKSSSSVSRGCPTRASAVGCSTHLPPTMRLVSRSASGPPTLMRRDQYTFSSIPIASPRASRSLSKPGDDVRASVAMRNPPSDSFRDPGSACVAMLSRQPVPACS
jgi:hypothetical protein